MVSLTREEQELHINATADDRDFFYVGTNDPYWTRRLDKIAKRVRESRDGEWVEYILKSNQVTLKKERKLTEKQRKILSERAKQNFHSEEPKNT